MNITDKSAKIRTIKQSTKGRVVLIDTGRISKKIILKEMSSDLLPVYRQLSAIRNRHFPRIYKLTVSGERLHVMKEYVEGKTLAKLLSERTFSVTEAIRLMLQLCEGVSCLHQSVPPIIHRDLTPWNILISDKAVLKIIDCDTARNYRQGAVCDTRRLETFEYTPPPSSLDLPRQTPEAIFTAWVCSYMSLCTAGRFERPERTDSAISASTRKSIKSLPAAPCSLPIRDFSQSASCNAPCFVHFPSDCVFLSDDS